MSGDIKALIIGDYARQWNTFYPEATRAVIETLSANDAATSGVFVGRAGEISRLVHEWEAPVTLVAGMAGIGKTALVRRSAGQAIGQGRFPGGAFLINMHGYGDDQERVMPGHVVGPFLRAAGAPSETVPAAVDEQAALYHRLLAGGEPALLVFDNVADLVQIRGLLPADARHRIVLTSRDSFGELAGVQMITLGALSPADAIALLDAVLRGRNEDDSRVSEEAGDAAEIARLCDHHPLALKMVAATLADNPRRPLALTARLLAKPEARLGQVSYGGAGGVRGAFEMSWRHLADRQPAATRLLAVLSLHPGADFSVADAAQLAGSTADDIWLLLDELTRADWIEPGRTYDRYEFHDLLRIYAREQCAAEIPGADRNAAVERLIDDYDRVLADVSEFLDLAPTPKGRLASRNEAMDWMDAELANLHAVINLAFDTAHYPQVCTMADNFRFYADLTRRFQDLLSMTDLAVRAAGKLDPPAESPDLLNSYGIAQREVGRADEAIQTHIRSLQLFRAAGNRRGEGASLGNLGLAYDAVGRTADAARCHQESLDISRELGDRIDEAVSLLNVGTAAMDDGKPGAALTCFQQALHAAQDAGHPDVEISIRSHTGRAYAALERYAEAGEALRQAVELARRQRAWHRMADALASLGGVHEALGRYNQAVACYQEELAVRRQLGDTAGAGFALMAEGSARESEQRLSEAADLFRQAATEFDRAGEQDMRGSVRIMLGGVLDRMGDPAACRAEWLTALRIFESIDDTSEKVRSLRDVLGAGD